MEPPAKRAKLRGNKAVPDSWATTPSVPWPGPKTAQKGVRYHVDEDGERKYCLLYGKARRPVCVCQPEGLCGLRAKTEATRPGYAIGCALCVDRKEAYMLAKKNGALPKWESLEKYKGKEEFVFHNGRECVTKPSSGQAVPLCACGVCFLACDSFRQQFATGCVHNRAPPCATTGCLAVGSVQGYCPNCAMRVDATAERKAEREPELLELMAKHGIARAPDNINEAETGTPYAQQNSRADWAARIVVRVGDVNPGFYWKPGCTHVGDDGTLCAQLAQLIPGGPVKCAQHGGGHRCVGFTLAGSNPEPCPYDIGIKSGKGKYGDRCVKCFCATNPNTDLAAAARQNYQAKEQEVRLVLERAFPEYRWTFDRAFAVGVRKRPDAKVVVGDRVVIVEVDELSHRFYGCDKERERERIFLDHLGKGQAVAMVRFNPDQYVDPLTGKSVPSCFRKTAEKDLVKLNPKQAAQWKRRCDALIAWVRSILDPTSDTYCETVPPPESDRCLFSEELFYDAPLTEKARRARIEAMQRAQQARKKRKADVLDADSE